MNDPKKYTTELYAEIKQTSSVNFCITDERLKGKHSSEVPVEIDIEGSKVNVYDEKTESTFLLPNIELSPLSCRGLKLAKTGEVMFTMQIDSACWKTIKPNLNKKSSSQNELVDKIQMLQDKCFCTKCGKKIITNHSFFKRVLPLPSDNWTAHTDMWFCHNHGDNDTDFKSLSLLPKSQECFVGSCFFLVQSSHLNVLNHGSDSITCPRCKAEIGAKVTDKKLKENGHSNHGTVCKIYSQAVIFIREDSLLDSAGLSSPCNSEAFYAQLISEQSHRYTSFRLILSGVTESKEIQCLIWLIDPNMSILHGKTSEEETQVVIKQKPVMKIMYKCHWNDKNRCSKTRDNVFDEWMKDNCVHGFSLPYSLCYNLITSLAKNTQQLPKPLRYMNSFLVGLLHYDK